MLPISSTPALHYFEARNQAQRDAPFLQMQAEGLLPWAMSGFQSPNLDDWRRITASGVLLCCGEADSATREHSPLLGCGHFTPFRGLVWEFDFTAFHAGFHCAAEMARGGFAYMFDRHKASAIMGITPTVFRHARALAAACGFSQVTSLPSACYLAAKQRFTDGVFVVCTPASLRVAQKGV